VPPRNQERGLNPERPNEKGSESLPAWPDPASPLGVAAVVAFGLAVGSFLNVLIWRLPLGLSPVAPHSYCPSCERRLEWFELVPVVSYLVLGGRCRTCRAPISPVYPLVELGTGALFGASVLTWGWSLQSLSVALFGCLLIVGGVIDARHRLIPDRVTLPGLALGLVISTMNPAVGLLSALLGVLVGGGFLLAVAVATGGGMGGGDIKLGAVMGAFLGWQCLLVALLLGFLGGAAVGGALLLAGRKKRRDLMAFGPFLAAGALVAAFWGATLINWYITTIW